MAASSSAQPITVALVGNPNTGKSTLFSALAGVRQRIGNYPGVTVEKKTGQFEHEGRRFEVVDLPGTYSLAPRSPDEMVAVDVLLARRADVPPVDAVLSIVDASNLERNLYLVSQVLELGLPTVIVLNMTDVARSRGLAIDVARLGRQLGVPVVEAQANRRLGLAEIKRELAAALDAAPRVPASPLPAEFQAEVERLAATLSAHGEVKMPRYLVERLLLDSAGYLEGPLLDQQFGEAQAAGLRPELASARARFGRRRRAGARRGSRVALCLGRPGAGGRGPAAQAARGHPRRRARPRPDASALGIGRVCPVDAGGLLVGFSLGQALDERG